MTPGLVELQEKVVQVSAGDSHTAALTEDGRVFVWGSFRVWWLLGRWELCCWWLLLPTSACFLTQDNNGVIGLLEPMQTSAVPVPLQLPAPVLKIASGEPGPRALLAQLKAGAGPEGPGPFAFGCSSPSLRVCLL